MAAIVKLIKELCELGRLHGLNAEGIWLATLDGQELLEADQVLAKHSHAVIPAAILYQWDVEPLPERIPLAESLPDTWPEWSRFCREQLNRSQYWKSLMEGLMLLREKNRLPKGLTAFLNLSPFPNTSLSRFSVELRKRIEMETQKLIARHLQIMASENQTSQILALGSKAREFSEETLGQRILLMGLASPGQPAFKRSIHQACR